VDALSISTDGLESGAGHADKMLLSEDSHLMTCLFSAISQLFSKVKLCVNRIHLEHVSPVTALADKYNLVECLHQVWLGWLHFQIDQYLRFGCFLFAIASRDTALCKQITMTFHTSLPAKWNKKEARLVGINVYRTLIANAADRKTWQSLSDHIDWVQAIAPEWSFIETLSITLTFTLVLAWTV
jgi:hypothetical protein